MRWKKTIKALLFPHLAIMLLLIPIATVFLVYAMVYMGTESVEAIISYIISAYTLAVWCIRMPYLVQLFKRIKEENKYIGIWRNDAGLRVNVSLYGTLIWNVAYGVLHLGLGYWHRTFWYYSLAGYYIALAVMRFFLVCYTSKHKAGEKMREELIKYRVCGIVFLIMNAALSLIVFFMVYWNRTFYHHVITTIALAAYTFSAFTISVIGVLKYRKYNSPVYSASKAISLASACVSMLTLESTMLTTFGENTMDLASRRIFLGVSGGLISAFIMAMAVYMIVQSNKKIKLLRAVEGLTNG